MGTSKSEPRIDKLPKWARDLIEGLDRKVSELEKQRDTLTRERTSTPPEEAKIGWGTYAFRDIYPIPDRAQVTFSTERGLIHCDLRQGILNVRSDNDTLVVISRGGVNNLSIETR